MGTSLATWQTLLRPGLVPVVAIDRAEHAVPLARSLMSGGINIIEVTLRTAAAMDSVHAIREALPDFIVGVGTITSAEQLNEVVKARASFGVSPGLTPSLLEAVLESDFPLLPGVATASEVMVAMEAGFTAVKFFPAEAAGGLAMLKAFSGPFGSMRFCPTGGINADTALTYFAQKNVIAVGGSWMAPASLIAAENWEAITELSIEAVQAVTH